MAAHRGEAASGVQGARQRRRSATLLVVVVVDAAALLRGRKVRENRTVVARRCTSDCSGLGSVTTTVTRRAAVVRTAFACSLARPARPVTVSDPAAGTATVRVIRRAEVWTRRTWGRGAGVGVRVGVGEAVATGMTTSLSL